MLQLTVTELKARMDAGEAITIIDVREAEEWAINRLPGAVHIPMGTVPARLEEIPRDRLVVLQCHHGGRSAQVTQFLLQQGYSDVANLAGGIHAWSLQIDPSVPTY